MVNRIYVDQKKIRLLWIAGGALAVAAVAIVFLAGGSSEPAKPAVQYDDPWARVEGIKSFEGTAVPGQTPAQGGALVLSPPLLEQLDYFLTALGEKTYEQIKVLALQTLGKDLSAEGLKQLEDIINRYFAFRQDAARVSPQGQFDVLKIHEQMLALRERHFTAEQRQKLFKPMTEAEQYQLQRAQLLHDETLTAAQRSEKLKALLKSAPEQVKREEQAPVLHVTVGEAVEAARKQGADDTAVFEIRKNMVGEAAAQRLATLDEEKRVWQGRVAAYKELVKTNPMAAEQFKKDNFSESEQLRLDAYR